MLNCSFQSLKIFRAVVGASILHIQVRQFEGLDRDSMD